MFDGENALEDLPSLDKSDYILETVLQGYSGEAIYISTVYIITVW